MLHDRPMREDFEKTLVRIVLQSMAPDKADAFIARLANDFAPDVQVKLYAFVKAMVCYWAGGDDLSREDAAVIEDCRKICDLMGWPPAAE